MRPQLRALWMALILVSAVTSASPETLAQNYHRGSEALKAGDFPLALQHFRPLADQGHAKAQNDLGGMYEYGRGVERDDAVALEWYRKAAKQRLAVAQYKLGVLHENGWGVPQDKSKAIGWYNKAATQGHAMAQHDLAFMYAAGSGVPKDYVRAYMWLRIAVSRGNNLMVKHLHYIRKKMTPAQIEEGGRLAGQWVQGEEL